MPNAAPAKRRGLTKQAIVERALQIGDAEGLEAVSVRRLATELGVTPMALYRHVKDKQDLFNAMYDHLLEGFDLEAGISPSMSWTDQLRQVLANTIALHERPVALPLAIVYDSTGSPSVWRLYDRQIELFLKAGFSRGEAVVLIRLLSTLVAGYLMLFRQAPPPDAHQLMLARKRYELALLSLPPGEYPNLVDSAHELTEAQFSEPTALLGEMVELMVAGVEAMLQRKRGAARRPRTTSRKPPSKTGTNG